MADLPATAGQTVGPFFGFALPYPGDRHLVPPGSRGAIRLHGTVYDGAGTPVPDALLEIRQADPAGAVPMVEGSIARDGVFTGWGRAGTDAGGQYAFTTLEPGPSRPGGAAFFAMTVFARGLLDRLFTRVYVPAPGLDADALLAGLDPDVRSRLVAVRDVQGLHFDVHLQGERETPFLRFAGDR
jgi:protocatechuate 3,4-dioxygenase, alpha subunit